MDANVTARLEESIIQEAQKRSRQAARAIPDLLEAARELLAPSGIRIQSVLGKGGNGVVFLAQDERLQRPLAIKAMLPGAGAAAGTGGATDPAARTAFLREAQILAQFTHEHIVQVHDVIERGELVFILMEYVEGESLAKLVERRGPLPEREALLLAIGVLRGVEAAHRAGLLHRDIKPENILLGRDGSPRVVDFGLAANRPEAMLDVGQVVGTPSFMAPEQALGQAATPRTDIYSVGLCLRFMLTAERPHSGATTDQEVIERASVGELTPVEQLRPDVTAATRAALARALDPQPNRRFLDAQQMREACEEALLRGGYRPPGARRLRRGLLIGALAAVPVIAIIAGLAAARWRVNSERSELARALQPRAEALVRELDAQLYLAANANPDNAVSPFAAIEELRSLRAALDAEVKAAAASAQKRRLSNPATLADLMVRAERLLLPGEIRRLAAAARPPLGETARRRVEEILASGEIEELRRLRRTLLYAPETLK